jgi:predicted nuclease of predicted toxin-antitoxin system
MNLSKQWKEYLCDYYEILHWSEIGNPAAKDKEIFEYAAKNDFIVFTNDYDFGAILAATKREAPSVFQLKSQDLMPMKIGSIVLQILQQYENQLMEGCLLITDLTKNRVRILPL